MSEKHLIKMESFVELLTRATKQSTKNCTVDTCPVSASVYGYYPNKPVTLILIVLFGISMFLHIFQGVKSRSWTFVVALGVGCFGESVGECPILYSDGAAMLIGAGYIGRLLLRDDPWSRA